MTQKDTFEITNSDIESIDFIKEVVIMGKNDIYRVTGRYMTGSEVRAYHLVNDYGDSMAANKEKVILMISRGQIENMRVQYSGDNVIIRGKGINLNELPIFDIKKDQMRDGTTPNGTKPAKKNPMAQFNITKRIMYGTSCVGYILTDASGKELRVTKDRAFELAMNGYIANADAQRYTPKGESMPKVIIRGVGCNLQSLPVVLVDNKGKAVDTSKKNQSIEVRLTMMKKSGILYDTVKKTKQTFGVGDYMVCMPTGNISIMKAAAAKDHIRKSDSKTAICDTYIDKVENFEYEFFGDTKRRLSSNMVAKWPVVTVVREPATA